MSDKKLTILGIIATILVFLAVLQSRYANKQTFVPAGNFYLIQGLDTEKIASIVLGTNEGQIILARRGQAFLVANKDDYPADTGKINTLISLCLDLKAAELVTDNPANHNDLGVAVDKARYIVEFIDKDSQPITGLVVSAPDPEIKKTFARLTSSDEVYSLLENPWFFSTAMDYIDKTIIKIERDNISSVTVTSPDGSYTLESKGDDEIVLENMPEGKQFKRNEHEQVFSALTNLQIIDVKKETSGSSELKFDTTYLCRLKDSTVYTLAIAVQDDKAYFRCNAMFTDKTTVTKDRSVESEEELKKKEAKLVARDNAESFSKQHTGWIYEVNKIQADNLTKALSDILEDVRKKKPEETTSAPEPAGS
jgi:hypothetical protein